MNDKGNNGSELEKTKDVIYNQLEFPIKRDKNCRTFKAILYQKLLKKKNLGKFPNGEAEYTRSRTK